MVWSSLAWSGLGGAICETHCDARPRTRTFDLARGCGAHKREWETTALFIDLCIPKYIVG